MEPFERHQFIEACNKVCYAVLGKLEIVYTKHPTCEFLYSEIVSLVIPPWKQWEISINGILKEELAGPVTIKMSPERTFKADDLQKLESVIAGSKRTNPFYLIESVMPDFLRQLPDSLPTENPEVTCPTHTFIKLYWQELLMTWHGRFMNVLMGDLTKRFEEKMLLVKGFHNLSQVEIPQHIVEILKKGEKFSPHIPQPDKVYEKQFRSFVWDFVRWAARVLCGVHVGQAGKCDDLDSTLEQLSKDENDPLHSFWWSIGYHYNNFKTQLHVQPQPLLTSSGNADSNMVLEILQPGIICTTADKNYGLVILPVEVVRQAEVNMLRDLGGVLVDDMNEQQIMERLNIEDANLRSGFMSKLLACFPIIPRKKQKMAFLKLNPKIHKLSATDLNAKNLDSLKFRPVCDSKFFTTKPCAQALASLLVALKEKVFCLYPSMREFYPLSGADVARKMRFKRFPTNDPFNLIVSCDLSDAYSNTTLEDLIGCSRFLSAIVRNQPLDQMMIEGLANFALNSNYIECGGCIYKCGPVLPMGSCLSGDALDVVLMAGELRLLINPPLEESVLQISPPYLTDITVVPDFQDYERYRDDTKILVSATESSDIVASLTAFARAACPRRIPISFEYSTFNQSFLSCCFFSNFAGRSFSTYPRLNFKRPSKVIHPSSNTWLPQLFSGFISTTVDFARICSDPCIRKHVSLLLEGEMLLAGHSKEVVSNYVKKAQRAVTSALERDRAKYFDGFESYSALTCEIPLDDQDGIGGMELFPPGAVYDEDSNVFSLAGLLVSYSSKMIPVTFKGVPAKNSSNLKNMLASKAKYKFQLGR